MTRMAILADIHGNLAAFEAASSTTSRANTSTSW